MGTNLTVWQKKELISLLFRLLNNQRDFSWKELESICFNMKYFEECVTNGDWFRAEEYISAFIEPETDDDAEVIQIFSILQSRRDNVDKLEDKTLDNGNMLKVLRELIEVVRQRVLSKLRSNDGLAGVPDIPLRSLVDALSSHGCKRTSDEGHQVERRFLEPKGDIGTRQFWRAMAGEQDVMQEAYKVEEAKAAADRAMDLATRKRERAQMLLQNSELATYKAVMAVHIAEAAEAVGSTEDVADLLLDRD